MDESFVISKEIFKLIDSKQKKNIKISAEMVSQKLGENSKNINFSYTLVDIFLNFNNFLIGIIREKSYN